MGYLVTAVGFHIRIREVEPVIELDPGTHLFSHLFIRHTKYLNLRNRGVLV